MPVFSDQEYSQKKRNKTEISIFRFKEEKIHENIILRSKSNIIYKMK